VIGRFAPLAAIALALWALVAALAFRGIAAEERDAERRRDDLFRDVARRIERAARRDFEGFVEAESHRPFYHYPFFHVPETVAGGAGVSRSPLRNLFENRYVRHYFQMDDRGRVTTPYWNHDLAGANEGLTEQARRARLEGEIAARFGPHLRLLFLEEPRPAPETVGLAQVVTQQADNVATNFDPSLANAFFTNANEAPELFDAKGNPLVLQQTVQGYVFAQNGCLVDPSGVVRVAEGSAGSGAAPRIGGSATAAPAPVEVRYSSFASIAVRERRLLLRRVNAGGRRLLQGFELDPGLAAATLAVLAEPLLLPGMALVAPEGPEGEGPAGTRALLSLDLGGVALRRALVDRAPGEAAASLAGRRTLAVFAVGVLGALLAAALTALYRYTAERVAFARERGLFAAAVSHELRTPLAGLKLHAELLEKGWTRADPRAHAGRIRAEAERLARLVENVLGGLKAERGEALAVVPRPSDPREPARRAHALFAPLFEERGGLRLEIEEAGLPASAPLDPDAFSQVLANLLDNALRHGRGAVRLRVSAAEGEGGGGARAGEGAASPAGEGAGGAGGADGEVGGALPARRIRFEVADEGPGLDPESASRAFDRVFAPSPGRGASGGLGLGLAMVGRLAAAHGGRARCEVSRFTVEVPA
jgi:signal transduction histidine kinase